MGPLDGKVCLVTGGNGGLGRGIVEALARQGAAVAINYVAEPAAAAELVERIVGAGGRAIAVEADVAKADQVETMVHRVVEELGRLDVLVNNAGVGFTAPILETEEADWDRVMGVNLKAQFLCARAAVREMRTAGRGGRIVNIASEVGIMGLEELSVYATSKAGVIGLTKVLAKELAPDRILVNCVAPGPFDTSMLSDFERTDEYLSTIPAGRLGRPEELGDLVAFLASEAGSFFVGQTLSPNGGVQI